MPHVFAALLSLSTVCPNPSPPEDFHPKQLQGVYYDYLSTAEYDAQTFCVTSKYEVISDTTVNVTVSGWHNGLPHTPGAFQKTWRMHMERHADSANPSQFKITDASMPEFLGTIVNFYWAGKDHFSFFACFPQPDGGFAYEIHGLWKLGSTFTGEHINQMQNAYFKNNLNPQNLSLKISPHPDTVCSA